MERDLVLSEAELVLGLNALANGEAPPCAVDPHAARRAAVRQLRRRRVVGAALLVTVLAAGALALPGRGGSVPEAVTVTPARGLAALTVEADFGWLPGTANTVTYEWRAPGTGVTAVSDEHGSPGRYSYGLTVQAAGVTPSPSASGGPRQRVDAPAVNGAEAYWDAASGSDAERADTILNWRAADGRWLSLTSSGLTGADRERVPLRIAAAVEVGRKDVPLPLRLTGPTASGLRAVRFTGHRPVGQDGWELLVWHDLGSRGTVTEQLRPDGPDRLGVEFLPDRTAPRKCRTERGVELCVSTSPDAELRAAGGIDGWLAQVRVLGADPAGWSAGVLD
ncbi:hypothetical protein ACIA8O_27080 [Kitasatospora sp. NPDC051853]|uniref:hypothetical protein n=1 Tax=Kitasatospora sp. NPDC051853 TaxID=3364058 RepID=UPI0037A892DB